MRATHSIAYSSPRTLLTAQWPSSTTTSCPSADPPPPHTHTPSLQECFHAAAVTLGSYGVKFVNETGTDPSRPRGCTVTVDDINTPLTAHVFFNKLTTSTTSCAQGAGVVVGGASALVNVSVHLDSPANIATLTLSGPDGVWFGVGFGAQAMADQPWTIIVDGAGAVTERKIGAPSPASHVPGTLLNQSVWVVRSTAASGVRTVVVTRPLAGHGPDYFTFDATAADPDIPIITAVGSGPTLAYHKAKLPVSITMLPAGHTAPGSCVCPQSPAPFGQATGQLVYHKVRQLLLYLFILLVRVDLLLFFLRCFCFWGFFHFQ
jgi:hypothetical protein